MKWSKLALCLAFCFSVSLSAAVKKDNDAILELVEDDLAIFLENNYDLGFTGSCKGKKSILPCEIKATSKDGAKKYLLKIEKDTYTEKVLKN